jgi:hypothetical protein
VTRAAIAGSLGLAAAVLALHASAWLPAAWVVARNLHPPPVQSAVALGASALLLRVTDIASRRSRMIAAFVILAAFGTATIALPLDSQFAGNGYMGDGWDYGHDRTKFDANIPVAAGHPEIHFKSHLGDLTLAAFDWMFGHTEDSPAIAYRLLSHLGGLLFIGELLLVLHVMRGSRRAYRYVALALGIPIVIGFFSYYEVGYMAVSIAMFPLLLRSVRRRADGDTLEIGAGLQGLRTAFHGFGLLGIAGGTAAALGTRERPVALALRFTAFALAGYLAWILVYVVVFKLSIVADPYAGKIAIRHLAGSFYFDRRLVHPLLSWNGVAEIGMASMAIGVPLFLIAVMSARPSLERRLALLYALPGLLFLIVWWPSAGVGHDMDLLFGAFAGIGAAIWLASRTPRTAFQAWIVLAVLHVALWAVIADRTMERIWITGQ